MGLVKRLQEAFEDTERRKRIKHLERELETKNDQFIILRREKSKIDDLKWTKETTFYRKISQAGPNEKSNSRKKMLVNLKRKHQRCHQKNK